MHSETIDVAIIGGGLVGASLAAALEPLGLSTALVESQPLTVFSTEKCWDERCIALNAASQRIYAGLGLWDALAVEATAIESTHISERGRFGVARFAAVDAGLPALGYNMPMRALGTLFAGCLPRLDRFELLAPASLKLLRHDGDAVELEVEQGATTRRIRARLLVAADGAESFVRQQLGIAAQTRDYGQSAVVTAVRPQRAHRGVAYERFLPAGPLALLPKPDDGQGHACSLVWTVETGRLEALMAASDDQFMALAHEAFGERLGRFLMLGRRQAYPLRRVVSEQLAAPRVVFIGNAAQSLHPVAAQGFNLGLRDVAALVEALAAGGDPGTPAMLDAYRAARLADRRRTAGFTDGLVRVFSNAVPGLRQLRHLGLLALDLTPPLKQAVLRQNLGLAGPVPRLARS